MFVRRILGRYDTKRHIWWSNNGTIFSLPVVRNDSISSCLHHSRRGWLQDGGFWDQTSCIDEWFAKKVVRLSSSSSSHVNQSIQSEILGLPNTYPLYMYCGTHWLVLSGPFRRLLQSTGACHLTITWLGSVVRCTQSGPISTRVCPVSVSESIAVAVSTFFEKELIQQNHK